MSRNTKHLLCIASVVLVLVLLATAAFADASHIRLAAVEHGTVTVTEENGKAIIRTAPDKGYITVSVRLGGRTLSASEANVYSCTPPIEGYRA